MVKKNIAIAILIVIIIAIFAGAIIMIFPHEKKAEKDNNDSVQPVMKISDVIDEAVYMGSYSADTEIYADEQFAAKDVLRTALVKSSGISENMPVMIESYNYDTLSVCFDDGRTMRTIEQPGTANVMIVASIPKPGGDVYYAYNIQISVNESRSPKTTNVPDVTGSDMKLVTHATGVTTVKPFGDKWGEDYYVTTDVTKKTWVKVTTAHAVTAPPVTEAPSEEVPETEPPAPTEPDAPSEPEPDAPSEPEPDVPADPTPDAPPEPIVPDPPAEPEDQGTVE